MSSAENGDVIDSVLGIVAGSRLDNLRRERSDIRSDTQKSYEAVLRPREPGGLGFAERASLAARIARQNEDADLARHYDAVLAELRGEPGLIRIARGGPATAGGFSIIVDHADRVTMTPRISTDRHIEQLKDAGIATRDIVSLSELIAFVNYQARTIAGLRLLATGFDNGIIS